MTEGQAFCHAVMGGLNAYEQAVHLTRLVDMEVKNGGFNQYYFLQDAIFRE